MSSIVEYSRHDEDEEVWEDACEGDFIDKISRADQIYTIKDSNNFIASEVGNDIEVNRILLAAVYPYRNIVKAALDKFLALLLLILLLPLMLIIGFIIRRDNGPAIFAHQRIGLNGKAFYCLKYRTMVVDSERVLAEILSSNAAAREEWNLNHKLRNDARVTKIGGFLRRSSLDELPQLINVLRGEMSLVGPRPITNKEVPKYGELIKYYLLCRPGITGLWQVSGRNDVSYERRIRMDAFYARKLSFRLDLGILILTMKTVVLGEGAS